MTDVEMVVRMTEIEYKHIRNFLSDPWMEDKGLSAMAKIFLNGTVLDKDHGRIIDESKITETVQINATLEDKKAIRYTVTDAPTIAASNIEIKKDKNLNKETPKRLTNKEWIDLLSEQFDVSRTSAKEMLHAMMSIKEKDNFKKQLNEPAKTKEMDEDMQEEEER